MFDSAPESIKKYGSRSGNWSFLLFALSERSGIVQKFSLGGDIFLLCFVVHV